MGAAIIVFRVYPKDGEFDKALASVKAMSPAGIQTEDLAFGIKAIQVMFKFEDAPGKTDAFEAQLRAAEGVGEVEVKEESLI